jgi:hypothetical protein
MKLKTNKISRKGTRAKIKKLKIKRIRTEVEIPKKKSSCNFLGEREERRGKKNTDQQQVGPSPATRATPLEKEHDDTSNNTVEGYF